MKKIVSHSLNDLPEVAKFLIENAKDTRFIAFSGNLGAGKTTLIGEILKTLGVNEFNGSPTFSLLNEYLVEKNTPIYHFDFYRLNNEEEALDIGWEEYLQVEKAWIFVEWPEKIENLLPSNFLLVKIEQDLTNRIFELKMF